MRLALLLLVACAPPGDVAPTGLTLAAAGWTRHVINGSAGGADGSDLADVDGDGDLDVVSAWERSGIVRLLRNPGDGSVPWPSETVCAVCPAAEDAHLADLDGDGALDVIVAQEGGARRLRVFWGPTWAADTFSRRKVWMVSATGQIDGLHGPDVVAGSKGGDGLWLFLAPAQPRPVTAWPSVKIAATNWIMGLVVTDLDGDGDADVLASDRSGKVAWWENPTWAEHLLGMGSPNTRWLTYADLSGDGRKDVVVADQVGTQVVRWYEAPLWTARSIGVIAPPIDPAKAVAVADVNGDGRADVALASEFNTVQWLSGTGPIWAQDTIWSATGKFDELHALDLGGSPAPDLLTTTEATGVLWFQNPY